MQFALDYWMYPSPDEDMKQFLDRLDGEGLSIPPAAAIKQAVSAPVFGVGFATPEKAEAALEKGEIDLAMFARALWADPDIAQQDRGRGTRGHSPVATIAQRVTSCA